MERNKHTNGQKHRVAVFIDGSNFYYKLKSLSIGRITYFDYNGLSQWLAKDREVVAKTYFIGVVRAQANDAKGQLLRRNQRKLFSHLASKKQGFLIERGYLMKNDGVYHEKGVDVKMAVDLVVGAYEDTYDTAILVSSDTDLIPAIEKVRALGKTVEYVGFSHKPSLGLISRSSESKLLSKDDLQPFEQEKQ